MPKRRDIIATSLTKAMLTARNVFSSSFTISALSVLETGTTVSMICEYSVLATSRHVGVLPPITLGVFCRYLTLRGCDAFGREGDEYVAPELVTLREPRNETSRVVPG